MARPEHEANGAGSPPLGRRSSSSSPLVLLFPLAPLSLPPLTLDQPPAMSANKVKLSTSDQEEFDVDRDVANRSVLIKNMLEGTLPPGSTSPPAGVHS